MGHRSSTLFSVIIVSLFILLFSQGAYSQDRDSVKHKAQVEQALAKMSVKEKVAQLFIVEICRNQSKETVEYQNSLVRDYGLGHIIFMGGSVWEYAQRMDELQALSKVPIMVAIDGEWGAAMRFTEYLPYPRQAQLARIEKGAEKLLYKMGRNVGKELKDLNIYVNYAPVADVSTHSRFYSQRSFSNDPQQVARLSTAYMKGMQDEGIYACGKHYPGHGATTVDSHLAMPVIEHTRQRLDTVDLLPYYSMFANGLEMVMLAHISFPDIDPSGVPVSISSILINDVLKKEQGFKGIVITDAIQMKGLTNENRTPVEAALAVYKSGSDMLLMPGEPDKCIEALTKAVENGELPMEELDNKVRRVLMLKARAGYLEEGYNPQIKNLEKKISAAKRRDARLIKKMERLMRKSGKPVIPAAKGDPTLILDKAGK